MSDKHSYGESLRAAAIVGGGEGIAYIIGLVRTKIVAALLGPAGVGLVGLYLSYAQLIQTVSGLGIASSGVREVAKAVGDKNPEVVASTVLTLRRACWVTGLLGLLIAGVLAWPVSGWLHVEGSRAIEFALLGIMIATQAVSGGQKSLLQGTRRLGDLTKIKVYAASVATFVAAVGYGLLGREGIVPVLIITAFAQLVSSWHFSRKVPLQSVAQPWKESLANSRELFGLGVTFMWSALLGVGVSSLLGFAVVRQLGLEANGIYGAAWMISGLFAGFILGAMGTDFYPRLTAAQGDHARMARLVNEQTEIGILLALPGLLGTLALAPLVVQLIYSKEFLPAADILPLFVLGVFGQVVTWPLGYILMAKGAKGLYAITETISHAVRLLLSLALLSYMGLKGLALAMPILYVMVALLMLPVVYRSSGFTWSAATMRMLLWSALLIGSAFLINRTLEPAPATIFGVALTLVSGLWCVRGLTRRLGEDHKVVRILLRVPGMRVVCGPRGERG